MRRFWETVLDLHNHDAPFVIVTLTGVRGSAPSDPGAKMIVLIDGTIHGTVGGGKVEARVIEYSKARLTETGTAPFTETWNLQKDIGMTCGGEVTFLFETVRPSPWRIAVFGAGHVAQALVRVLIPLSCSISCIDPRKEWLERLPDSYNLKKLATLDEVSSDTFVIAMTQGHAYDVPILEKIFKKPFEFPFVGVIGSAQKGMRIKSELSQRGVSMERLEKLHCPIGINIGTNQPEEIAISIAAELLQVRDGQTSSLGRIPRPTR